MTPIGSLGRSRPALWLAFVCPLMTGACSLYRPETKETEVEMRVRAARLAEEILIVDTHIDVPYRLMEKEGEDQDLSVRTMGGDFDYPRARAGGLNAAFMSIYVPAHLQKSGGAREYADRLIDLVESLEAKWQDEFALAHSVRDVEETFASRRLSLALGMENGAAIEDDLSNLRHFFERGVRYITLTHSENNQICDSSYADEENWGGLSPFGREVVREMNRLGIMIDVSHVSDETFFQVMELTSQPVIASHSSCRHFTPGWERNMSDEMIRRLAQNGGVLQINFGSAFLTEEANRQSQAMWEVVDAHAEANGLERHDHALQEFVENYRKEHPMSLADISDVVDHIDHVVELAGVDHVGFGSDFDGVGPTLPRGLEDVSAFPNLIFELLARGYSEEEIRKIAGGNLIRVWRAVEAASRHDAP
jgi:membrane dipeptidase